ncbi:MAG: GTP-binding protein [Desulfatirhabdiaceae bacterium]
MSDNTQVYLITGFLGAGKTTFLNRIISQFPKNRKLTLLVNEFGEIGVDGTLVEGEDIDMMEISKGSIFCVCVKTDFIKGLYALNTQVQPDVLLIESTGVANPSDLKKDLKLPIFNDRFRFMEQFCVIDAIHFLDAYHVYASIEKQIASSSVFIINKVDVVPPDVLEKTREVIREFHPDPVIYETTYANIPFEKYFDFVSGNVNPADQSRSMPVMSDEEMDEYLDNLLDSPDLQITPPDLLMSVAYQWTGNDLDQIRTMANALPAKVLRAKGFVKDNGNTWLFNYVMGDWTIENPNIPQERIQHNNTIVFIGPPDVMDGIGMAAPPEYWINIGSYQPFTPED